MKTLACLLCLVAAAHAAELTLADGRTLKDYFIVAQTPTTVTVKHANGAAKVDKRLLPADILKIYPIDEAGAKAEAEDIATGRAVYAAQVKATAEKRAAEHQRFLAEVESRRAANKNYADAAAVNRQARGAKPKATTVEKKSTVTRTESRINTPTSLVTETEIVQFAPEGKRRIYTVEYEIEGAAAGLEVRCGENSQHHQFTDISSRERWTRRIAAKSGDRLYLWARAGAGGGEGFRVRIRTDNAVVKESMASGINVAAELSYTLP